MVLYYLKATGEYGPAVREWENKATADKTWPNIKIFISNKYTKENKQTKISAKQFKANLIKEQAEITEELINNKYKDAPVCKHCGKKHPYKKEEECWVLEANAASRPSYWKPIKNT
jgi:hypothetical protein